MKAALSTDLGPLAAVGTGSSRPPLPTGWDDRLHEVFDHGLAGLLAEAWRTGEVVLTDPTLNQLEERLLAEARRSVQLEAEILRLSPLMRRYRCVVLKGAALAHGAYPDPGWRPFTDIDVLVPTHWLPAMIEQLVAYGYHRPPPDPCPGFLMRVGKATSLAHPAGTVVDLHRTLAAGNLGDHVRIDEILADTVTVQAGAVEVVAPSWPAHLIEVALHAVLGDGLARGLSLRDVVQVAAHPEADPKTTIDTAGRWGVSSPVATAVISAHEALAVPLPEDFRSWAFNAAQDDLRLRPDEQEVRSARLRLDELRHGGIRRRSTLIRSLLVPSPGFVRWRYGPGRLPALYWRRWTDLKRRHDQGTS